MSNTEVFDMAGTILQCVFMALAFVLIIAIEIVSYRDGKMRSIKLTDFTESGKTSQNSDDDFLTSIRENIMKKT